MTKCFFFLILVFLIYEPVSAQSTSLLKNQTVRIGYGYSTAGSGDIPGHQLLVGLQSNLSNHSLLDLRLGFTILELTRNFSPVHSVEDKSNGVSVELEYGYSLKWGPIIFYPSLGPALRYSHEIHPDYISIRFDPAGSGQITDFEAPSTEKYVLKLGATGGLNLDVKVSKKLTFGVRTALQVYKGNTVTFVGLTLKNIRWHL